MVDEGTVQLMWDVVGTVVFEKGVKGSLALDNVVVNFLDRTPLPAL